MFALACAATSPLANADGTTVSEVLHYQVVNDFPHNATHYTQGLEWHDGHFTESSGGYGVSALFDKKRANGATVRSISLPHSVFAEGLTRFSDRIFLLTWRERIAYVFSPAFKLLQTFSYEGEGWGLTHDGAQLIMSDGSHRLSYRDPQTFALIRRIAVRDGGVPIDRLNELEYVREHVLANVWQTDRIAMIEPRCGQVRAWLDLSALQQRLHKSSDWDPIDNVLNGIAYDPDTDHLYVTGKRWPRLFELQVRWPDDGGPGARSTPCGNSGY